MPHMLLVSRNQSIHPKCKAAGARLTILDKMSKVVETKNLGIYSRIVGLPGSAPVEEWIESARLIHKYDPFDHIGGFSEPKQDFTAEIAADLGLFFPTAATIHATRHKAAMREILRAAGLDDTPCALVKDAAEIAAFGATHGYPFVLKPEDGRGSLGVSVLRSEADVPRAVAWFERWASEHVMLAEGFLVGEEYSVEGFSEGGQHRIMCVTQKFKDPATSVETGHCVPAPIDEARRAAMAQFVPRVLDAIGLTDGPSHTEVIVTAAGPRVVETHARCGGDCIGDMIKLLSGFDVEVEWVNQQLGQSVLDRVPVHLDGFASVAFATPNAVGTLLRVEGIAEAETMPGVAMVLSLHDPGEKLEGAYDSYSRGALVVATGGTSDEAIARAQQAVASLRFVLSCAG